MRLLSCRTLGFKEFFDSGTPPYLISSHRWGDDEVSYKDFYKGRQKESAGYRKIVDFCTFASDRQFLEHGTKDYYEWVWVDTCCIDKRSSAELSEAINSMYRCYEQARECVVHLSDVPPLVANTGEVMQAFKSSAWFTRGWTLQELLAPKICVFCTCQWEVIGYVHGRRVNAVDARGIDLVDEIAGITGIQRDYLQGDSHPLHASIARRMSWAAHRKTTRVEDQAYCLLGIFGVDMPLLYGEQKNAFRRLQEELIQRSSDHSILLFERQHTNSILSKSPSDWSGLGGVVPIKVASSLSYLVSKRGLEIESSEAMTLRKTSKWSGHDGLFVIALNCTMDRDRPLKNHNNRVFPIDNDTGGILILIKEHSWGAWDRCSILTDWAARKILQTREIKARSKREGDPRSRVRKFILSGGSN